MFRELARCRTKPILTVLDVGAARGDMAARFVKAFPRADIHCFEPQRNSAMKLELSLRRRRWDPVEDDIAARAPHYPRVRVHFQGLLDSDIPEYRTMYIALRPDGSSFLPLQHYMAHDTEIIRTDIGRVSRLDTWCAEYGVTHIDFLKIDVEGVELEVLRGGTQMLQATDNLFIEISPLRKGPRSRSHIEVFQLLFDAGFVFMNVYQSDYWFSRDPEVLTAWFGN